MPAVQRTEFLTARPLRLQKQKAFALISVLFLAMAALIIAAVIHSRLTADLDFTNNDINSKTAFYLAEAGISAAMFEMASTNYSKYTHNMDGTAVASNLRLQITLPDSSIDTQGWTLWQWNPGDTFKSFTLSGKTEKYRYRVYLYSGNNWTIESEGSFGNAQKKIQVWGTTEGVYKYAIFSDGDLGEFSHTSNQSIYGRIHANGDIYIRPSNSTLNLYTAEVSTPGKIIRYKDAWGRLDQGGTANITNSSGLLVAMNGFSQGASGAGKAFDSENPDWLDPVKGAQAKWGGIVQDGSLGGTRVAPIVLESLVLNGYYYKNAGLIIDNNTQGGGVSNGQFYHIAEDRRENVKEVDLSAITYPANGLLYAATPIRIINASTLKAPLTIVSNCNVYTQGDVNKVYGNVTAFNSKQSTKQPFALITSQRIYHLSSGWKDGASQNQNSNIPKASDPALFNGDDQNTIEINAALIDGSPTIDERNYVKSWNSVANTYYTGKDTPAVANSDDLLEDLSGFTLKKRGSIIHLNNAVMAAFDNSNAGPGILAWIVKTSYVAPIRDYGYDNALSNPLKVPPFTPGASKKSMWKLQH
ncbi:MAG: hypothetical protein LWY06_20100 [Firmicutes bacterium]|nr:hypothetical protein [Bacillota bacterium]